jgi:integrase/recombinase XerD
MIEAILQQPLALSRHRAAPLLLEREQFLSHLLREGTSHTRVRSTAAYLIQIVRIMGLTTHLESVQIDEIKRASESWAKYRGPHRGRMSGVAAADCFNRVAKKWFRFHGLLANSVPATPYDDFVRDFVERLASTKGLSIATVRSYGQRARYFLKWLAARNIPLSSISLLDVDDYFACQSAEGWRATTLATEGNGLRAFFRHASSRGWCVAGLSQGVRSPAIPKYDGLAKGPTWKDVRRLLNSTGTNPAGLRARAIMSLCSIYALRSSEVARLRLSDFDWRDERFSVQRAKRGVSQQYPIQYEVGETILAYLTKARPRCSCRHLFVTLNPPYRPLVACSMWQITSRRMNQLKIASAQRGPHALRHACATHLLNKGTPLKGISDFLGHRDSRSIGVYAKFDIRSLRKVASFRLGLR